MKNCLLSVLLLVALCGCDEGRYSVPERHRPKVVMGKDYWTLLFSFYFTDPGYLAQCGNKPDWMNNPALGEKPVFRDCALVQRGDVRAPDPDSGKATYRTLREYYATNGRWQQIERDPKPDKPMILQVGGMRGGGTHIGEIDLDYADFADWKAKHPNFLAFWTAAEWDNDPQVAIWNCTIYSNSWRHSQKAFKEFSDYFLPIPKSRYERAALQKKTLARKFDIHFGDREHSSAMRASVAIDHMAAAWGVKLLQLETTNSTRPPQEYRWNIQPMFTRGAARQFGIPWEWYVAIFVNGYRKDGSWMNDSTCNYSWGWPKESDAHPERGLSQSLQRRVFYFAYLSGANFVEQEGWYGTFLMKDPETGKATLSPRGQDFSDFHDFTVAHPDRGTPYTPVAVLVPYEQGYPAYGGRSWMGYAYTPGDQTVDAVFFTIDPGYDRETFTRKGGEANLHNSKYAMMYDVVCPDAPQKPEDLLAVLKSYKAVLVTGDYRDRSFEKTLAVYEKEGGRVIHIDPKSLPPVGGSRETEVEILTGKRTFPAVAKILDGLQAAYFPFQVTGDVMYGANLVDSTSTPQNLNTSTPQNLKTSKPQRLNTCSHRWWLWCFNNKGVTKFADQFQEIDPKAVAPVSVDLGCVRARTVRELLSGRSLPVADGRFSFVIPAGDLAIFEVE